MAHAALGLALGACSAPPTEVIGGAADVWPSGCVGGIGTFALVYGAGVLLPVLVIARALRLMWRDALMRNQAEARVTDGGALVAGPAVLHGVVAEAEEPAVRIEIAMAGEESKDSSGNWSHTWREVRRQISVRPFDLELPSGERVHVETPRDVYLADHLDGVVRVNRTAKKLVAELTPGESVTAVGVLERRVVADGYRGTADTWVLVPPRSEPMTLSTLGLGHRFEQRRKRVRRAVLFGLFLLSLAHAWAFGYHARIWFGERAVATWVQGRTWTTTDSDDNTTRHRSARVQLPDGRQFEEETWYQSAHDTRVWVMVVRSMPGQSAFGHGAFGHSAFGHSAFGHSATLHLVPLGLVTVLGLALLLGYLAAARRREWYDGERQKSRSSGRLTG